MKKIMNALIKVETLFAALILLLLILSTFGGVIMRYCFSMPFTWEEEFQLACMVWISFLAAPIAFHTKSHVAIEILVDAFPNRVRRVVEILIAVIMYAVLLYFFFRCFDFLAVLAKTGRKTPILMIPYTVVYGIAPVSILLMLVSYTYETVQDWLFAKRQDDKEGVL